MCTREQSTQVGTFTGRAGGVLVVNRRSTLAVLYYIAHIHASGSIAHTCTERGDEVFHRRNPPVLRIPEPPS